MSHTPLPLTALELLAPARDADTGIAAIDHGADAVYIGGPAFGARQSAGNTMDDIASLAEYAHRYNARVFMALNTLFTNEELPRARSLAFDAAKAGVDVLIVQDMGLMAGPLPDIELHASTQCDIRTPEKAAFLEKAGFSQMVLARELSLAEVAACRAALHSARIEYFIHGALCVSYSGQCYISEAITGRSANRGACAQLCRLPYDVYTKSGEQIARRSHVLSLRDNNQTDNLEALIDAGVSSFKIEGRLKDLVYVKNITAWYRQQLDAIIARRPELSRTSDGVSTFSFTPDPEKSFQRSRTDYFVHGRQFAKPYELAQLESPKNTGSPVGCCERVEPGEILVRPAAGVSLANGDGLTYLGDDEEIHGLAVNRADPAGRGLVRLTLRNRRELPEGLRRGMTLMRNLDRSFVRELSGESAVRRIPIVMTFLVEDDALTLIVTDGRECAEAHVAMDLDAPSNPERNRETLIRNLGRLGDTLYTASDIFVPEDLDVFVPASVVNMMRREAVDALTKMREEARVRPGRAPVTRLYRRISDAQTVSRLMKDTMALGWSGFDMLALSPAEQETMRRRRMFVDAFRNDFDWTRLRALELSQSAALLEAALYVEMVQPADIERLRRRIAGEAIARCASWTAFARALLCARTFCSLRDGALSTRSRIAEDEARLTALLSGPWQSAWPRVAP